MRTEVEINKLLKAGGCVICGYNRSIRSLVFHHKHGGGKGKSPSYLFSHRRMAEYFEEVGKCILLCTNCHGEVHDKLLSVMDCPTVNVRDFLPAIEEIRSKAYDRMISGVKQ